MTTKKEFSPKDRATTKTILHESIPITGSILSGTYSVTTDQLGHSDENIKVYGHGMFQSVYDYPYLSSSANHLFDITAGFKSGSGDMSFNSSTGILSQSAEKENIYSQMASMLVGYDATGSILPFRYSGSYNESETIIEAPMFINFSRLLVKDEINKEAPS